MAPKRSSLIRGTRVVLAVMIFLAGPGAVRAATSKQESLDLWRRLTSETAPKPEVYFNGKRIRCFFEAEEGPVEFKASLNRPRVPTDGYKVRIAQVHLDRSPSRRPEPGRTWRRAVVITGPEWRLLTTNVFVAMTPSEPGQGAYYQGLVSERLLFRDAAGQPRSSTIDHRPGNVSVQRQYSIEETLGLLARLLETQLEQSHPGETLFLMLAPGARRFPQPLLLDVKQRQCVWLAPAELYDSVDKGFTLAVTLRGLSGLIFQSHGLGLIKNPVSSAARLADLGVQTVVRFVRFPLPKPSNGPPPVRPRPGMDLVAWEHWLDRYTATHQEEGALELLIDGEQFFPRLERAIAEATHSVHVRFYVIDNDDVAVQLADQLKARSQEVQVRVILDQMGSLSSGVAPPATPLPEGFVAPASITSYLRQNSKVEVRPSLNPWFSVDHVKVVLIDGGRAWLGGMNIGREYRYEWHDLMVEITGPVVGSLESEYQRAWAHRGLLGDLSYVVASLSPPRAPPRPPGDGPWIPVRLLPTRTAWKPFSAAVQASLRQAQDHVFLQNPYLFDTRVIAGLVHARQRGVDVRVILGQANDFAMGGRGNLVLANYLIRHGVRVFFYPGMTHVKALLVDGWACLGSGNLNHLSLRLCQEQNVATSDPTFAEKLRREVFERDFARSYELTKPIDVGWADVVADVLLEGF